MEPTQNVNHGIKNTHRFIFRGKEIPFNIHRFNEKSSFFGNKIPQNDPIILLNEDECNGEGIETAINTFLEYIQNGMCILKQNEIPILYKLANKFQFTDLSKEIYEFMQKHSNDYIVEFLTDNHNHNVDNYQFEVMMANNLLNHINNAKLLEIPISSMRRIIQMYRKNHQEDSKYREINQFLYKYLEKNGKDASILYEGIDLRKDPDRLFQLLNSETFNGHYADKCYLGLSNDVESEIIKKTEKNEMQCLELRRSFDDFKANIENKINNLVVVNNSLHSMLDEKTNEINNLNNEITIMKIKINEQESQMNEKTNEINRLNAELIRFNEKQQSLENTNKEQQKTIVKLIKEARKSTRIINDFDLSNFIGHNCTLEKFNTYNAETQKFIFSKIELNNDNKRIIEKVRSLLDFLSEQQNNTKSQIITKQYIYIRSKQIEMNLFDIKYIETIEIPSEMVQILYANNSLDSDEFRKQTSDFNEVILSINTHEPNYQELDNFVKKLISEKGFKFRQGIDYTNEDNIKFQDRKDLYSIKISVKNISGGFNQGLCERNQNLKYAILSNTETIGNGAFY